MVSEGALGSPDSEMASLASIFWWRRVWGRQKGGAPHRLAYVKPVPSGVGSNAKG